MAPQRKSKMPRLVLANHLAGLSVDELVSGTSFNYNVDAELNGKKV